MSEKHLGKVSEDVPLVEGKLRLYSMRFCPYAHRVHLVLNAKEIPHDVVNINLNSKPDWYIAKYTAGKVPLIHIDGQDIYESLIISDFLDEKYPQNPLMAKDPLRKAQDRLLVNRFTQVAGLIRSIYAKPAESIDLEDLKEKMDFFESVLAERGTRYFSGENPGMVDYMIWPWCERINLETTLGPDHERFKRICHWARGLLEVPAVKKHFCSLSTHAQFFKGHFSGQTNYDDISN